MGCHFRIFEGCSAGFPSQVLSKASSVFWENLRDVFCEKALTFLIWHDMISLEPISD